jgi:putative FmdB family regulatory protein
MPVYTYRCESCGVQFERHQFFHDPPLKVCPECRKKSLKKVISPVRVVFKGSGFYSTDHRPSAASSTPPMKSETKSEGKEDPKPAAAPKKSSSSETSD